MTTRRLSVSSIVIAAIVVVSSLSLGGMAVIFHQRDRQQALSHLSEDVASDAAQLASGLALSVWNLDDAQIQKNMESVLRSRYICGIQIEADGTPGYALNRAGYDSLGKNQHSAEQDTLLSVQRTISYNNKTIGHLRLYATPAYILQELKTRLTILLCVILGFELFLVLGLFLLIRKTVLIPLHLLEQYALSVNSISGKTPKPQLKGFHGELDTLRASLETMVQLLQQRHADLEKEARLRAENEERMRAVYDSVNDAIFIHDPNARLILDLNSRACELFGRSREHMLGSPIDSLRAQQTPPADPPKDPSHFESLCKRSDGSLFWGEFNLRTAHIDGANRLLLVVRDINDRKTKDEERRRLESQLNQSQKLESIGILAGGIAHDFNNILAAILGYCELAKDASPQAEVKEYINDVLKATNRAKDLVRQILSFSRQEKQELRPVILSSVIKEVLKLLKATFPDSISFHLSIPDGLPLVSADPSQVHQVLMNLCANAEYAMRGSQGHLTVALDSFTADENTATLCAELLPGSYLRLSVADSGHGIEEETLKHIFDPFFTTKKSGEGTGLGLSVVHGIMKAHHGAITVYSRPREGSVFTLYFPTIKTEHLPVTQATPENLRGQGQRVLFVDNEILLCRMAEKVLQKLGYQPTIVSDPISALKHLGENKDRYELLISDLSMPGMSGLELAEQALKQCPSLPIIIMTGYIVPEKVEEAKRLGVSELLMKPMDTHLLSEAIRRNLRAQQPTAP